MEIPLANYSYGRYQNLYPALLAVDGERPAKRRKERCFKWLEFQPRLAAGPGGPARPHRSPPIKGRAGVSPRMNKVRSRGTGGPGAVLYREALRSGERSAAMKKRR